MKLRCGKKLSKTEKLRLSNLEINPLKPDSPDQKKKANPVSPKKLLLSKWTAVTPVNKEKHFLVTAVVTPEIPGAPITDIDLEAALTQRIQRISWRDLKDTTKWKRGWT